MGRWRVTFTVEARDITDAVSFVLFPGGEPLQIEPESVTVSKVP